MARKVISKGITSSFTLPISDTSCSLDTITRVCGFSLGNEEATRIANISLIQAKEDAMAALLNTKQKILPSSTEDRDQTVDECTTGQYPLDQSLQGTELLMKVIYYLWIKDEDPLLEHKGVGECREKKAVIRVSQ